MQIHAHTTATTDGWEFVEILVDESYWDEYIASTDKDTDTQLRVYQSGVDQGLITLIQN
jgi:hypothetical protein